MNKVLCISLGCYAFLFAFDFANAERLNSVASWHVVSELHPEEPKQNQQFALGDEMHLRKSTRLVWEGNLPKHFRLDMKIKVTSMAGIGFYGEDELNYEYVFFRTGNESPVRAIQYIPIYNGALAWHLYSHHQYQAPINANKFFDMTLACAIQACVVSVNGSDKAHFNLDRSTYGRQLFLRAMFGDAVFKDVRVSSIDNPPQPKPANPLAGALPKWALSSQLDIPSNASVGEIWRSLSSVENKDWTTVHPDADGIVNLAKYYSHPKGAAFAKTCIQVPESTSVSLKFDYSHFLTILLNGNIIFSGRELDTHNFYRLSVDEERIELPLVKGKNELRFLVHGYDLSHLPPVLGRVQYMNWGFLARLGLGADVGQCN